MKKMKLQKKYTLTKLQLEKDYLELKSLNKISKKYSVSPSFIWKKFKSYGIVYDKTPHIYYNNHNLFSEDNEKSFYLAGFIAADGCIRISKPNKNKNHINHRLVIALSEKDYEFLYYLREIIGCENPIGHYTSKSNHPNWKDKKIVKLSITSKKMVEDLRRFNVGERKSLIYYMPEWLVNHPLVNHFIRGYNDGDGSFYILKNIKNNHITFSMRGTMTMLNQIKLLFTNNNIVTESVPKKYGNIGQFSIHSNKNISKIVDFLYKDATIYLPRKFIIANKAKEILFLKEEIEKKITFILHNI